MELHLRAWLEVLLALCDHHTATLDTSENLNSCSHTGRHSITFTTQLKSHLFLASFPWFILIILTANFNVSLK